MSTQLSAGIDITSVLYKRGVSRYTHNLVEALLKKDLDLSLYGSSFRSYSQLQNYLQENELNYLPHVIDKIPPSLLAQLWRFGFNKITPKLGQVDVFHSWDWLQPPDKNIPLVSTIHDLAILKYPETAHPTILKMHQQSWKVLRQRNADIIAVSHTTKKDILELLNFPEHKVHVIYEALPAETETISDSVSEEKAESIKQKFNLTQKYILFVGTREPRKNLAKLIEAWLPLSNEYQLLIAGDTGWDSSDQVSASVQNDQLRFLGRVEDEVLSVLYAEAELLAFPSLYEGFGLPILEAFHHGTPVVTSNISSMPEVAGNAAELVDPHSVESIRAGLEKVLNESTEDQKKRLQKMIIRLHSFSWKRVADETVNVYKKAVASQT